MPQTKQTNPLRVKMRAVQQLFHDQRLVEEGEVFLFKGTKLPSKDIAVKAEEDEPFGIADAEPPPAADNQRPEWSTTGYVERAHRNTE